MVVQSREREIDIRDLITLPVYLSSKNERKRKKNRNDKASFENILYVCCSHIYIFLDASPRFRLVEHCTFYRFIISTRSTYRWYRASGRELGETCRSMKRKKRRYRGIFFVLNVATVFTEYSIKNCLPF